MVKVEIHVPHYEDAPKNILTTRGTKLFLDGKQLHETTAVAMECSGDGVWSVTVTFLPTELEIRKYKPKKDE